MNDEELLKIYIQKIQEEALQRLKDRKIAPLDAIREALNMIEGEMKGY